MVQTSDGRTITCFARTAYVGTNTTSGFLLASSSLGKRKAALKRRLQQASSSGASGSAGQFSTAGATAIPTLDLTQPVQMIWGQGADFDDGWVGSRLLVGWLVVSWWAVGSSVGWRSWMHLCYGRPLHIPTSPW